jgi:hypothetical protein
VSDPGARPTFAERLEDPLSHFPYKRAAAQRGYTREVLRTVINLGLQDIEVEEQLSQQLQEYATAEVEATAAYVAAQETYLREPTPDNRAAERAAADAVVAARCETRLARPRLIADAVEADAALRRTDDQPEG